MSEPKKPGGDPAEFKKGLKDALRDSANSHDASSVHRFCVLWWHGHGRSLPPEFDGISDRTYGYHTLTTVLRTLREESLPLLCQCWLPFGELRDACRAVLGHDVPEDMQRGMVIGASEADLKAELADKCEQTIMAAKAVMAVENDHVMQHQLTSLIGELQWCAREYGKEKP